MCNIRRFLISIGKHILEKNPSARNLSKGRRENFANLFAVKDAGQNIFQTHLPRAAEIC